MRPARLLRDLRRAVTEAEASAGADADAGASRVRAAPSPSAGDCVERVQAGDVAAFEAMFRAHAEELTRYVYAYLHSRDEAREVVQDLFLWIWEHRGGWQVSGSLAAYLFRSAHNRAFGRLRRDRLEQRFRDAHASEAGADAEPAAPQRTEDAAELSELARAVDGVIAQLPARCREVFVMNRQHHLTYSQIAEVLGISVKTVEAHMARALKALRASLADWTG